uniref:Centrosomal protein 43 n=1 Tax=Electrophorus electricus TaxID=8005 RepID=A0A4W4F6Y7_ELEEL
MSATEEDTELRDLLIQNLENNGVLNKIKAELRAAVFLALEEQDKVENKTPLVNENLRKCLNTKDGRIVASLITDYLQVFNLDFTLAVFQPEINTLNGHESRESLIRDLGLSESEGNKSTPLLLELIKRVRHKEKTSIFAEDFLGMYKSFFTQCRSVITNDVSDTVFSFGKVSDEKITSPTSKPGDLSGSELQGSQNSKAAMQLAVGTNEGLVPTTNPPAALKKSLELSLEEEEEEEEDEGDSFFDDPLPKPLKTYGCLPPTDKPYSGQRHCEKSFSQKDLSALGSDTDGVGGAVLSESEGKPFEFMHYASLCSYGSHQSENSKSEVSIGEEIEEVSIEGPDLSDKLDEITQDLSVSQLSEGADYMEDVA